MWLQAKNSQNHTGMSNVIKYAELLHVLLSLFVKVPPEQVSFQPEQVSFL